MRIGSSRIAFAACVLALAACKDPQPVGGHALPRDEKAPAPNTAAPAGIDAPVMGAPVAATSLVSPIIYADHALVVPKGSDVAVVRAAVERALASRKIEIVSAPPTTSPPKMVAHVDTPKLADMGFSVEALEYFGRGLEATDRAGLAKATDAIFVSVIASPAQAGEVQRIAAALVLEIAGGSRAWITDSWTGETFTAKEFTAARAAEFPLDVRALIRVHTVRDEGNTVFLETRGMPRFGLPELIIRGAPHAYASDLQELVNAAAQTLVERGKVTTDGALAVDYSALRTAGWADTATAIAKAGGSGTITFDVTWSHGDYPDAPDAPVLVELSLPGKGDVAARAYAALHTLVKDPEEGGTAAAEDDTELNAARDRARVAFAALLPGFAGGIAEMESLTVKAPFHTNEGGIEWMWVEIESVKGEQLIGTLLNEPFNPAAVHAGDRVEVKASEIFDYKYQKADGTKLGGETDEILLRRQPFPR